MDEYDELPDGDFEGTHEDGKSAWHQQVTFSDVFFTISKKCREHQANDELNEWKFSFMSKLTSASAILDKEQKTKAEQIVNNLEPYWNDFIQMEVTRENNKKKFNKAMISLPMNHPTYNNLRMALMAAESQFDEMVNKKMPFLNVKKKIDFGSF